MAGPAKPAKTVLGWSRANWVQRHGGLVPAAELLIRLARVEDQPGDLVRDGQNSHHAGFLGFPGVARRRHVAVTVSLRPRQVSSHHPIKVICLPASKSHELGDACSPPL